MLGHTFYFFGLILLLINLGSLSKFFRVIKIREWSFKFTKVTSKKPKKSDFIGNDYDEYISFESLSSMNFCWMFFGIISGNWIMFLMMLLMYFTLSLIANLLGPFNKVSNIIEFIKSVVITSLIGILVINHFHLHLNLWKFIFP